MNIEQRIFNETELSYEQLNQMKEHAKQYDYVVDKKEFLKNITPYEQKLVLLETRNPYEVLNYLDELDYENTRLILSQLTPTEIRKIIDEFTSEDKKKFYANFSDLSLVNQFIIYDANSKDHITTLKTERKVDILNSSKEETKEAATKVYDTIDEKDKEIVYDSIISSEAKMAVDEVVADTQFENKVTDNELPENEVTDNEIQIEVEIPLQEAKEEQLEESEEELEESEEELEETEEDLEKMKEGLEEETQNVENVITEEPQELKKDKTDNIQQFDTIPQQEEQIEEVEVENKKNLEMFQESKTNCEQELIEAVMSTRKKDSSPIEDEEKTTQKTL